MTSSVLVRPRRAAISTREATDQLDLLFDKFFEISQPLTARRTRFPDCDGEDQLESVGSAAYEVDEVCTDSQADSDQEKAISEVAKQLRTLGDKYSEQYGEDSVGIERVLTTVLTQAGETKYEAFKNTLESLMTHDTNALDFAFIMCLSNSVVSKVGRGAARAKTWFRRYISESYVPAVVAAGGIQQFVAPSS